MRDALNGVADAVREVVQWVDAPLVAGVRVVRVFDSVHDGVAQRRVGVRVVDFSAEANLSLFEEAAAHVLEHA